jgi:hypothetical protein
MYLYSIFECLYSDCYNITTLSVQEIVFQRPKNHKISGSPLKNNATLLKFSQDYMPTALELFTSSQTFLESFPSNVLPYITMHIVHSIRGI